MVQHEPNASLIITKTCRHPSVSHLQQHPLGVANRRVDGLQIAIVIDPRQLHERIAAQTKDKVLRIQQVLFDATKGGTKPKLDGHERSKWH